jgi:hypothetical protein
MRVEVRRDTLFIEAFVRTNRRSIRHSMILQTAGAEAFESSR